MTDAGPSRPRLGIIVNPIAAYALSRYKPPSTYKVLLFLMMTMAFPPMVSPLSKCWGG